MNARILLTPICWLRVTEHNLPALLRGQFTYPMEGHIYTPGRTVESLDRITHYDRCGTCGHEDMSWHDPEGKDIMPCCDTEPLPDLTQKEAGE
jgi:hypothetical protein